MASLSWMNGTNQIAQAGQWGQQYGSGAGNTSTTTGASNDESQSINQSWEIARKALEKVQGASSDASNAKVSPKKAPGSKQAVQSQGASMQSHMYTAQGMQQVPMPNMANPNNYGNYYNPMGQAPPGMYPGPYGFNYPMPNNGMNLYGNMMGNQYHQQQMYNQGSFIPQYTSFEHPGTNFQQQHQQQLNNKPDSDEYKANTHNQEEQGANGPKQGNQVIHTGTPMKYNNQADNRRMGFNQQARNKGGNQAASQEKQSPAWVNKKQAPGSGNIRFNLQSQKIRPNFVGFSNDADESGVKNENASNINKHNQLQKPMNKLTPNANKFQAMNRTLANKQSPITNQPVKKLNKPSAAISPGEWPESLKNYVQRAFATCETESDKDVVESTLKKILTTAFTDSTAWSKNWDKEPLPLEKAKINQLRSSRWDTDTSPQHRPQQTTTPHKQGIQNRNIPQKSPGFSRADRRPYSYGFRRSSRSRSRSRSRSWSSRSRSRSRSRSPYGRKSRRRRSGSTNSDSDSGFIPVSSSWGKGRGRGRGKGKGQGGKNQGQRTPGKKGQKNKKGQVQSSVGMLEYGDEAEKSHRMQKRAARFCDMIGGGQRKQRKQALTLDINTYLKFDEGIELNDQPILGTCQSLTKQYLRLTSAPHPSTVRPVPVLRRSLQMVKQRWKKDADYNFVCEQLKSIRQDLTIQCVREKFSVEVYETHARIALEKGDREEFNQCQTQLKALYLDHPGHNENEFTAYRILYQILTKNTLEMANMLGSLTSEAKKDESISHALEVHSAWSYCNFHKLFLLYRQAPRMSPYMMDLFIDRERKLALQALIKSFRPHLPVSFVEKELAFEDTAGCVAFLTELGVTMSLDQANIDCKQSMSVLQS